MDTKQIIIRGKIKGHGIVNFDGKDQKFAYIKANKMKNKSGEYFNV